MAEPAPPERPRARPDVVFRQLDDEWVIYDPVTNRLHALNLTAALVWEHCTGERTVAEIAGEVLGAFEPAPDPQAVQRDVSDTVQRLLGEGLFV
jgi:hypothetical protein